MILCIYGTTGELIKIAPVLRRLADGGYGLITATTAQQVEQIPALLESLGLPQPDLWLGHGSHGRDLDRITQVPGWAGGVMTRFMRLRRSLRRRLVDGPGKPLVLVHGDTMTTVLGAMMGHLLRIPVAHVEAGLRSFDLLHPFPEEMNRRITSVLAGLLYAPGAWAASNLRRGVIVDTGSNTIRDSLAMSFDQPPPIEVEGEFGLVSLHRFELLNNRDLLMKTLDLLADESHRTQLLFVDHPVTVAALRQHRLDQRITGSAIRRIDRMKFLDFVALLRLSRFIFTDSGGNQEETYYLDIPCLVHRKRTERREGIGQNVVLSGYDLTVARDFLADPARHRRTDMLPATSPSDVIVSDLVERGYAVEVAKATREATRPSSRSYRSSTDGHR